MSAAKKQFEALEPLAQAAALQLLGEKQADPFSRISLEGFDEKLALFSIAISLRRIADKLEGKA